MVTILSCILGRRLDPTGGRSRRYMLLGTAKRLSDRIWTPKFYEEDVPSFELGLLRSNTCILNVATIDKCKLKR